MSKRILILCPFPEGEAAGQRLKYEQYFSSWKKEGYNIYISSFSDQSLWKVLYKKGNSSYTSSLFSALFEIIYKAP